jgi:uncharacterized membrane protein YdjX (TVP38/TMEM64 family)
MRRIRQTVLIGWLALVTAGLYLFIFHRAYLDARLHGAFSAPILAAYGLYLVLGAARGFTLLPVTTLVLGALPFFRPWPLLVLTLAGILISSASIYFFAEALHTDELVARTHAAKLARLKTWLARYEMPIIIGWSFFPLVPTDAIVYVCGTLRVSVVKCLAGVMVGEGAICAIYIFGGGAVLRWLDLTKP